MAPRRHRDFFYDQFGTGDYELVISRSVIFQRFQLTVIPELTPTDHELVAAGGAYPDP